MPRSIARHTACARGQTAEVAYVTDSVAPAVSKVFRAALEEPVSSETHTGVGNLRGWAVSSDGIEKVEIYIDGVYAFDAPYGGNRGDGGGAGGLRSDGRVERGGGVLILSGGLLLELPRLHSMHGDTSWLVRRLQGAQHVHRLSCRQLPDKPWRLGVCGGERGSVRGNGRCRGAAEAKLLVPQRSLTLALVPRYVAEFL